MDINNVQRTLGISAEQFDQLDRLDGKKDGQVEQSIFDVAQKLIDGTLDSGEKGLDELTKKIKHIFGFDKPNAEAAQAVGDAGAVAKGSKEALASALKPQKPKSSAPAKTKSSNVTQTKEEKKTPEGMIKEMAEGAIKYYEQNGSLKGFSHTGFPEGIDNLTIDTEFVTNNPDNDVFSIDENGKQKVTRNPDAFILKVSFMLNGEKHTVEVKTTNTESFVNKPVKEEIIDEFRTKRPRFGDI